METTGASAIHTQFHFFSGPRHCGISSSTATVRSAPFHRGKQRNHERDQRQLHPSVAADAS